MDIKGFDQLRSHNPDMKSPVGVVRLFLLSIVASFLVNAFFNLGRNLDPSWLLLADLLWGGLAFWTISLFFRLKNDYKARFRRLAYSRAVSRFAYPGVAIVATLVACIIYFPGPKIPPGWWISLLTLLGWALIATGIILFLRTLQTFGIDNLTMLYVYFPEESRLVNHRIYNILRHPAYASAICVAWGLALLNGSWFALASAFLFALSLWAWVHFVEEKELIERFGQSYAEYRQRVPAIWPHLRNISGFFGFIFLGK